MIGIETRTSKSGILVVRCHYTADEDKRTPEWLAKAKVGLPERQWKREYEIDWTIAEGMPIYADFNRDIHVAKEPLMILKDKAMYRGWDFGLQPACVWCQMDSMGRLNVLRELVTWDGRGEQKAQSIDQLLEPVIILGNELVRFERHDWWDYADPAGTQRAQTDERTAFEIMRLKKVFPVAGPMTFQARQASMNDILTRTIGGRPKILIDPSCTMIIEGLQGAYKFRQYGSTTVTYTNKLECEKNAWSHIINALEYVVGSLYRPQKMDDSYDGEDGRRRKRNKPRSNQITGY